jgi:hypothetical protein
LYDDGLVFAKDGCVDRRRRLEKMYVEERRKEGRKM